MLQFIFRRSFVAFALLLPSIPPLCLPAILSIHRSIPHRTRSDTEFQPILPPASGHSPHFGEPHRVIETWLIGERARNIGGITAAPRGILLSLAPLYNSRHHRRAALPPAGAGPACVSLLLPPSLGGRRRERTLIFGSVLTRLPAATTDISLNSPPPTRGEHLLTLKWRNART